MIYESLLAQKMVIPSCWNFQSIVVGLDASLMMIINFMTFSFVMVRVMPSETHVNMYAVHIRVCLDTLRFDNHRMIDDFRQFYKTPAVFAFTTEISRQAHDDDNAVLQWSLYRVFDTLSISVSNGTFKPNEIVIIFQSDIHSLFSHHRMHNMILSCGWNVQFHVLYKVHFALICSQTSKLILQ